MTREEIMDMEAGREMDELVAANVMGWEKRTFKSDGVDFWHLIGTARSELDVPNFSTDIAAAWEVVEKSTGFEIQNGGAYPPMEWDCDIFMGDGDRCSAYAPTAPLAICRAALLATIGE